MYMEVIYLGKGKLKLVLYQHCIENQEGVFGLLFATRLVTGVAITFF